MGLQCLLEYLSHRGVRKDNLLPFIGSKFQFNSHACQRDDFRSGITQDMCPQYGIVTAQQ